MLQPVRHQQPGQIQLDQEQPRKDRRERYQDPKEQLAYGVHTMSRPNRPQQPPPPGSRQPDPGIPRPSRPSPRRPGQPKPNPNPRPGGPVQFKTGA